jgi:hypothetical protein
MRVAVFVTSFTSISRSLRRRHLRHARFIGMREDKKAREVRR